MDSMIHVRDLERTYQLGDVKVEALRGISFDIRSGEFVAVMGPSGSGKSTLMNTLGCLDTPTSGQYVLDGVPVERLQKDELAVIRSHKIGFVFQQFHLLPRSTALANVELPLIYQGEGSRTVRQERAAQALSAVGLGNRLSHHPRELSGGQQQRVAIARALVSEPALLLADEPTGNLDSRASEEIMQLFADVNAQGLTIILVTHAVDVAATAQRVLTLRDGVLASDVSQKREVVREY